MIIVSIKFNFSRIGTIVFVIAVYYNRTSGRWTCIQDESDLGAVDLIQAPKSEPRTGQKHMA